MKILPSPGFTIYTLTRKSTLEGQHRERQPVALRTGSSIARASGCICLILAGLLGLGAQGAEPHSIRYDDGGSYQGQLDDRGNREGRGVYTYPDGSSYDGEWRKGVKYGRGVYRWVSGNVYIGEWRDNRQHGNGVFVWADGGVTEGRWRRGRLEVHEPWQPATRLERRLFNRLVGKLPQSAAVAELKSRVAIQTAALTSGRVSASRTFAGPSQYPPLEFAAYGIVAFPARPTPSERARHVLICNAYIAALPHVAELNRPRNKQMVTVWPVESDSLANDANVKIARKEVCESIVDTYGLVAAQQAVKDARAADASISGKGPFLLAWAPPSEKGMQEALVLVLDMSRVTHYSQAQDMFEKWREDIEKDPSLWTQGWDVERLRLLARTWVDDVGSRLLWLVVN